MSMTATGGPESRRPWAVFMGERRVDEPRLRPVEAAYKATRGGFFERFATTRQARIGHEVLMGVEGFLSLRGFYAIRGAIGQQFPALLIVLEVRDHDLVEHLLVHGRVEDRAQDLDTAIKV